MSTDLVSPYIDESVFEDLLQSQQSNANGVKFICEAPVGSGKSTAIQNFIIKHITKQLSEPQSSLIPKFKFIVIVPTVNIAEQFANITEIRVENEHEVLGMNDVLCVNEGAFSAFKKNMKYPIEISPLIVTTYSTASKCLGTIVEYFYRHKLQHKIDECFLIIDEAHLLLQHASLIETIRDFKNVGLLSATPRDIRKFKVFSDFKYICPKTSVTYDRTIYIHSLDKCCGDILNQITLHIDKILTNMQDQRSMCLVKVEDKTFCKKLKEKLSDKYNVYLYNSDTKEVLIDKNGKFQLNSDQQDDLHIDIVISTSCIQAGQSLKEENLVSLFVQTPIDIVSSVQQFIGRNRNPKSQTHLYLRIENEAKELTKFEYENNRYKTEFNKLKTYSWNCLTIDRWTNILCNYGELKFDAQENSQPKTKQAPLELGKEFSSKKALYKHYGFKSMKHLPQGYEISQRWSNKTRKYSLVKMSE